MSCLEARQRATDLAVPRRDAGQERDLVLHPRQHTVLILMPRDEGTLTRAHVPAAAHKDGSMQTFVSKDER